MITKIIKKTIKEFGNDYNLEPEDMLEFLTEWVCEEFAEAVEKKIPEAKACWDCDIDPAQLDTHPNLRDPSHCFINYNNKFYDAACPKGVMDWRDLPFFRTRQYLLR